MASDDNSQAYADGVWQDAAGQNWLRKDGQWVGRAETPLEDAAKSVVPAASNLSVGIGTIIPTFNNMLARGANAVGNAVWPARWPSSAPGQYFQELEQGSEPGTYSAVKQRFNEAGGPTAYSPAGPAGNITQGALQSALVGVFPEASVENVGRALLSGGASEAAGEAAKGNPYLEAPARALAGVGAYGLSGMTPAKAIAALNPRAGWAATMERGGVPVSAADISGSHLTSMLEGQPLAGQAQGISDGMIQAAGVPRLGGASSLADDLNRWRGIIKNEGDQAAAQTSIPLQALPSLRQQLAVTAAPRLRQLASGQVIDPEVDRALQTFDTYTSNGAQPLSGRDYQELHEAWSQSPNIYLRQMGKQLDGFMDAAHPNVWENFRTHYADLNGLMADDVEHGAGTLPERPLDPAKVSAAMYKETPMKRLADASVAITRNRPAPLDTSWIPSAAQVLGSTASAGAGLSHVAHGTVGASDIPFLAGTFYPYAQALKGPAAAVQAFFRTKPGQNVIRNFDPRVTAALLANQGIRMKQTEPPSQQSTE